MKDLHSLPPFKGLDSIHLRKGLTLPAMGLTAIELRYLAISEGGAQLLATKEGHTLPALDAATRLQSRISVTIPTCLGIRILSVDARPKGTVTRRRLLAMMKKETLSWLNSRWNQKAMDVEAMFRYLTRRNKRL